MELLDALVVLGTITFAATGALTAVERRFDLVGVVVLAVVTAVGGGSIRDVLSGTIPPPALTDEVLLTAIVLTGLGVSVFHRAVPTGRALYALDTLALGLFAALGAERGISIGLGFWGTVFAGAISGVGGGIIRDVLTGAVPGILYRSGDLYASAAAAGAATVFLLAPVDPTLALVAGAVVTIGLRVGSRLAGVSLPVPRT